jgi:DNA-directed RNA polymerase subunit RPC12/RpoP
VDCWERKHHRVLHEFRKKLKYCNNYTSKQKTNKKAYKNIDDLRCPFCSSYRIEKNKIWNRKQCYHCNTCGKNWFSEIPPDNIEDIKKENDFPNNQEYKENKHLSRNDENIFSEKILKYLRNNPGVKAITIASHLGVDEKQINDLLYGKLKGRCIAENYYWDLIWKLKEQNKENISGEFTIETIKTYIENKGSKYKPIVFYYLNDSFPRIIREYFLDGKYLRVRTDEGECKTFLLDKIRRVE